MEISPVGYIDLISRAVGPRPVFLITTVGPEGVVNLAPFSAVSFCSYDPPMMVVNVGEKKHDPRYIPKELEGKLDLSEKKDTWANIHATGEFVAHLVTEELLDAVVIADRRYPRGVSELSRVKLTPVAAKIVKPPRLAEAKLAIECQVTHKFEAAGDHTLVVARAVAFHADESALTEGLLDTSRIKPVVHYFAEVFGVCDRIILRKDRARYKLD